MDQADAPVVALTKTIIHLFARMEALETLLIQKGATKEEILAAIKQAEEGFVLFGRSIRRPDEAEFDPSLRDILERLKSRYKTQLR